MGEYNGPGWWRAAGLSNNAQAGAMRGPRVWTLALMALANRWLRQSFVVTFKRIGGGDVTFVATTIRLYRDRPLPNSDDSHSWAWLLMGPADGDARGADGGLVHHCVEYSSAGWPYRNRFGSYSRLTPAQYQDRLQHPSVA
jgi:hypothetical protein